MNALVITFREGIEAVLVIGIMIAFLRKAGRDALVRSALLGSVAAVIFSAAVAFGLRLSGLEADNPVVEGVLFLIAAIAVATMVAWMLRTGRQVKEGIETRMSAMLGKRADGGGLKVAMFAFAFLMVAREGVETVLFLAALAVGKSASMGMFAGALAGIALAIVYGVLFLRGSARIDLRLFFTLTALVLGLLSLKLLGGSLHEFEEVGLIPMRESVAHFFDWVAESSALDYLFLAALSVPLVAPWLKRAGRRGLPESVPQQ